MLPTFSRCLQTSVLRRGRTGMSLWDTSTLSSLNKTHTGQEVTAVSTLTQLIAHNRSSVMWQHKSEQACEVVTLKGRNMEPKLRELLDNMISLCAQFLSITLRLLKQILKLNIKNIVCNRPPEWHIHAFSNLTPVSPGWHHLIVSFKKTKSMFWSDATVVNVWLTWKE